MTDVLSIDSDDAYMRVALDEAIQAYDLAEVPIGAVVVHNGRIIGRGHNLRETLNDPTAHAEVIALTAAAASLESWRLEECTIYVTLEPCPMCAGALVNSRIARLVYGAPDPKAGACGTLYNIVQDPRLNHRLPVTAGVLEKDCAELLREFFRQRRRTPSRAGESDPSDL